MIKYAIQIIFILTFSLAFAKTPLDYTLILSGGYDSNVMRFSTDEIDDASQNLNKLGQSSGFDSFVSKYGFRTKKDLWVSSKKNFSLNSNYTYSFYNHTPEKRYWSGGIDLIYKWGSYKNFKYSLRHLNKFYLRYYIDRDISTNALDACYFTDRNQYLTLTHRLSKFSWINIGTGYLQRYYTKPFTEFDLDILYFKGKLNYKIKILGTLSIELNQGRAISESHIGVTRPSSFDRSYSTTEIYMPLNLKSKISYLNSYGFSFRSERRIYDAEDYNDVLHSGRSHFDRKYDFWIRKNMSDEISVKFSGRYRSRKTDSAFKWVSDLKSFDQLQCWINIEWDLIYDQY